MIQPLTPVNMVTNEILTKEAHHQSDEDLKSDGLLRKTGRLKISLACVPEDIDGFDYVVIWDHLCYKFYCSNPPTANRTHAFPCPRPYGLSVFKEYKINYKKAIQIFHSVNRGTKFSSLSLSKPSNLNLFDPHWHFISDLGMEVVINANSGELADISELRNKQPQTI